MWGLACLGSTLFPSVEWGQGGSEDGHTTSKSLN